MQRKSLCYVLAIVAFLAALLPTSTAARSVQAGDPPPRSEGPSLGPTAGPEFIDPTASALQIAQAIARDPSIIISAVFEAEPPITNTGNARSDTPLTQFPVYGSSYAILTSGNAVLADQPGTFSSTNLSGGPVRGDTDADVTILRIDLNVPTGVDCLSIDFQFLSEEFPQYVGTVYNDAFIAELDNSTWTTSGSVITATNNFAFDPDGNVVSINSTGVTQMSPANGFGTAYDGGLNAGGNTDGAATVLLRASTPIDPGVHALYLSIFDQGDQILDSAVFLDNLLVGVAGPNGCVPGATLVPEIQLTKTVGTDPTVCALNDEITVPAGTEVTYCYTVENTGVVPLNLHDLGDSELGSILSGFAYSLMPGASTFVTATATISVTTVNTATWTAHNEGAINLAVRASDTAFVEVEPPTAVVLASFVAALRGQQIMLTWETVSEIDNLGFNVLRSQNPANPETLVAFVPSQAPGASQGFVYRWLDEDVIAGNTYYYWLEDVDVSGATTLHGPVSTTVQAPSAVTVSGVQIAAGLHMPPGVPVFVGALALLVSICVLVRRR